MARLIAHIRRHAPAAPALLLLGAVSGCGTAGPSSAPSPPLDYAAYDAQATALHTTWDSAGFTDPATLPAGGGAAFYGVMHLRMENGSTEVLANGRMRLDVSFATSSLSGSAGSFAAKSGTFYDGALQISGGALDRAATPATGYTYTANLDGTLSGGGSDFILSGDLSGDFLGPGYNAASGVLAGTTATGGANGYLFGNFIAAR